MSKDLDLIEVTDKAKENAQVRYEDSGLDERIIRAVSEMGFEVIGVNSAKAANYVPSMCGLDVVYDDVENLIRFE